MCPQIEIVQVMLAQCGCYQRAVVDQGFTMSTSNSEEMNANIVTFWFVNSREYTCMLLLG